MLKLKIVNSKTPTESQLLDLSPETMANRECLLGRSRHCGIVLSGSEVSRVHASIGLDNNSDYCFADLASLGGSRLNHDEVHVNQPYPLRPQDILRIGEFILTIEAIEKVAAIEELATALAAPPPAAPPAAGPTVAAGFILPGPPSDQVPPVADPKTFMPVSQIAADQMGRWAKGDLKVQCAAVIDETHDAKTFRFVADPPIMFDYQPGQFVTLKLNIDGKGVKRSYSISSTPSRPHTLEITVKRVPAPSDVPDAPPGLVSNWLHDNLKVGSELTLAGPLGKFTCFQNPSPKLLLVSAGSGITPMMAMSRWMLDTAATCDIVFFHNARTPDDIIFGKELEWISRHNPNFKLAIATTRTAAHQPWWGLTGRLNEPMLYTMAPDFWERTVYVCGPNGFMASVKGMFKGLGFPMENYYEESFGGAPKKSKKKAKPVESSVAAPPPAAPAAAPVAKAPPAAAPAAAPAAVSKVLFKQSGKTLSGDEDMSILDIAEEADIEIDSSCRSGVCGTCKVKKLEGEINYTSDPDGLDEDDQEAGYILACVACPVGQVTVDA